MHKTNLKISIVGVFRDNEKYIQYLDNLFNRIEVKYKNIDFEYFMYENDSEDETKEAIINFYKNKKGKYLLEDLKNNIKNNWGCCKKNKIQNNITRGNWMSQIRNKLKDFHGILNSNFVLLIDADIILLPNTIEKLLNSFNEDIAMVSTYCIWYTKTKKNHYYDTFALITKDNISYKENGNTCLFKICENCYKQREKILGYKIDLPCYEDDKPIEVKSTFGCMSIVKTDIYNKVKWGDTDCEHHYFCKEINNYGKIIINPQIKILVTPPQMIFLYIEKQLEIRYNKDIKANNVEYYNKNTIIILICLIFFKFFF
jgi:hypothetical protein